MTQKPSCESALLRGLSSVEALADTDPLGRGDLIDGQYVIEARLGSGGFGHVYKARDLENGRRSVALKLLRPELLHQRDDESMLRLFDKEAYTAMHLQHPNIVVVHAQGRVPYGARVLPFMAMEFLQGMTLADHLHANAPLDATEAMLLAQQVLSALAYAHSQGVMHSDVKPGNIMIRDLQIKLLDFGLARLGQDAALLPAMPESERWEVEALLCQRLSHGGTYEYLPPEQWASSERTVATDLWATTMVLWQMLTGYLPSELDAPALSLVSATDREAEWHGWLEQSLTEMIAGPQGLRQVLRKALDLDPTARFASAPEFQAALLRAHPHRSLNEPPAPYYHLAPFSEENAAVFFGRERVTIQLKKQVRAAPLAAVLGISGAGKSSLVHAGLIPQLRAEGWSILCMTPADDPLERLARLVLAHRSSSAHGTQAFPVRQELPELIGAEVDAWVADDEQLLIVIDQFEELYTRTEAAERRLFCSLLLSLADDPRRPLRILLTLRDDYRPRLAELPALARAVAAHHLYLDPPDEVEMREALERPAALAGFRYEPTLMSAIFAALRDENPRLPMLQLIAARLWHERNSATGVLPTTGFEEGRLARILYEHADGALSRLPDAHHRRLARLHLCQLLPEQRLRREVVVSELLEATGEPVLAGLVLRLLEQERLISIREQDGHPVAQLSHDLLTGWPQLASWLREAPEWRSLRARLQTSAMQWEGQGKPDALLWEGQRLIDLLRGIRDHSPVFGPLEQAFIAASRRRQLRRYLALLGLFLVLVILTAVLYGLWRRAEHGQAAAQLAAQLAREEGERTRRALEEKNEAVLSAKQSEQRALDSEWKTRESQRLVRDKADQLAGALVQSRATAAQLTQKKGQLEEQQSQLKEAVRSARESEQRTLEMAQQVARESAAKEQQRRRADVSHAGKLQQENPKESLQIITSVLTESSAQASDEELRLLYEGLASLSSSPLGGRAVGALGGRSGIRSIAWGPKSQLLVLGDSANGWLQERGGGQELLGLGGKQRGAWVGATLWTSDGKQLWPWRGVPLRRQQPVAIGLPGGSLRALSAAADGPMLLLRYSDPDESCVVDLHGRPVVFTERGKVMAALSADGKLLATIGPEGEVKLRELPAGRPTYLGRGGAAPKALAFHPTLRRLLVGWEGSNGDSVTEVDLDHGLPGTSFAEASGRLVELAYSPDGALVLLHYVTARRWEVALYRRDAPNRGTGRLLARIPGASLAAFSTDGRWLALGDEQILRGLPLRVDEAIAAAQALLAGAPVSDPWSPATSLP